MLHVNQEQFNELDLELAHMQLASDDEPAASCDGAVEEASIQHELLDMFVRNQTRVAFAMPILALIYASACLMWVDILNVGGWLACVFVAQAVQIYLCQRYQSSHNHDNRASDWVSILAASEFLFAVSWSLPLFIFWSSSDQLQNIYLIATLIAVSAVRSLIANNFMPVVVAGTGMITLAIVARTAIEATYFYVILACLAVATEVFLLQLARRLQEITCDMVRFKRQREQLIVQLDEARIQAKSDHQAAADANQAKSRFLATMSHELRTPLNAIIGFSEILSSEMMGPHAVSTYKDYAKDIHHSGHYLLNMINDILDLSRIEAGHQEIEEGPINIDNIAADCLHLLHDRIAEKDLKLRKAFAEGLPKISGDERFLRQIWLNLLGNAIKFTPQDGTITIGADLTKNNGLRIFVSDTGPGIPVTEMQIALESFNRGSVATHDAIDGAGLGLPIVDGLAKLHDAELTLDNNPQGGALVSVTFPPRRILSPERAQLLSNRDHYTPSQKQLLEVTL